jgi:hypothetical protein
MTSGMRGQKQETLPVSYFVGDTIDQDRSTPGCGPGIFDLFFCKGIKRDTWQIPDETRERRRPLPVTGKRAEAENAGRRV